MNSRSINNFVVVLLIIFSFGGLTYSTITNAKIGTIGITTSSSASEIRQAWGAADSGSLLDVAITWSKFESLDETEQFWIVRFWSPGMAIIEVPLIWLENQIPIFWGLLVITTSIWIFIFYNCWGRGYSLERRYFAVCFR